MLHELLAFAFSFVEPRPYLSPVAWATANLQVSARTSDSPGPFSLRLHPYLAEPLDTFADGSVTDCVLMFAAQTGKSTCISAGALYRIANRPGPTLFVYPSQDNAQSYAETRLLPLLESSEQLRRLKPARRDRMRKLEWGLLTAQVSFCGSNSPSNLAARPISDLYLDEVDKFSQGTETESDAISLAVERTNAFPRAKRYYCSTPSTDTGPIWKLFQRGDERHYNCPCPHCNELIRLEWDQVQWDQGAKDPKTDEWDLFRVQKSAYYKCQKCGGAITDGQKTKMLRAGVWIASKPPARAGWRSYHLNVLYAAHKTFGELAADFITANQAGVSEIQNFRNSKLALPWVEKAITIKEEQLAPLLGTHERGTYDPNDGGYNLMAIDVQRSHLVYVVRRFFAGMRSYLVDWGQVPWWNDIDEAFAKYNCRFAAVDSGYGDRTQEVYEQIAQRANVWFAVKGQAKMTEFYRAVKIDPFSGSKSAGQTKITLLHVNDPVWTDELLSRLSSKTGGWQLTREIDAIYAKQILGVYKAEKKKRNGKIEVEIKTRGQWDVFDDEKYLLCTASMLGLGRSEAAARAADSTPDMTGDPAPVEMKYY